MDRHTLLQLADFQSRYLSALLRGIDDGDLTQQPGRIVNHPAWQLGHLAHVADAGVRLLGGESRVDGEWSHRFQPGSTPTADRADYPSKAELVAFLEDRRDTFVRQLSRVGDDELARPHAIEAFRDTFTTLWEVVNFLMLTHESTHLGQLAAWRRAHGLPGALPVPPR